ncbi:MAG TPA: hypothetical protein VF898_07980 [Chloroflexota bacterium]
MPAADIRFLVGLSLLPGISPARFHIGGTGANWRLQGGATQIALMQQIPPNAFGNPEELPFYVAPPPTPGMP